MTILAKLLLLLIWLGVGVLIILLFRIGRFWQSQTGLKSYHQAFLIPLVFFLLAALRYIMTNFAAMHIGDVLGDVLSFIGGISLILAGYILLKRMTGGGQP